MPAGAQGAQPLLRLRFLARERASPGFFILSEVILCATGGEALYADMGHLGREPIIRAWYFVFVRAGRSTTSARAPFILPIPDAKNVLFEMVFDQAPFLYIPFLLLTIIATIIASQAMISGMFSIVYQGITTRIMPHAQGRLHLHERQSQIYIGVGQLVPAAGGALHHGRSSRSPRTWPRPTASR